MDQGIAFEALIRTTYKDAVHIQSYGDAAVKETEEAVKDGTTVIFQATAIIDGYHVKADVFVREKNGTWSIHEVKSSTEVKDEHLDDIAFQKMVFEKAGYAVSKTFLVCVQKDYVRDGDIKVKKLKKQIDVTNAVEETLLETEERAKKAKRILQMDTRPTPDDCPCQASPADSTYEGCQCPKYCYPDLSPCSPFHITGMSTKKARQLYEKGIKDVRQCNASDFAERQAIAIEVESTGKPYVNKGELRALLEGLEFPLFYLDYETFGSVIPLLNGYRPYEDIIFQFSLHIQQKPQGKVKHIAFLWDQLSDPTVALSQSLQEHIGPKGTIIVWHKGFECGKNTQMGEHCPQFADFYADINRRTFDLKDVVKDSLCVYPGFRGSASLKDVLPALLPKLSYDDLDVQEGSLASPRWYKMVTGQVDKEQTKENLLKYCERDTWAMVKLYEKFLEVCY